MAHAHIHVQLHTLHVSINAWKANSQNLPHVYCMECAGLLLVLMWNLGLFHKASRSFLSLSPLWPDEKWTLLSHIWEEEEKEEEDTSTVGCAIPKCSQWNVHRKSPSPDQNRPSTSVWRSLLSMPVDSAGPQDQGPTSGFVVSHFCKGRAWLMLLLLKAWRWNLLYRDPGLCHLRWSPCADKLHGLN